MESKLCCEENLVKVLTHLIQNSDYENASKICLNLTDFRIFKKIIENLNNFEKILQFESYLKTVQQKINFLKIIFKILIKDQNLRNSCLMIEFAFRCKSIQSNFELKSLKPNIKSLLYSRMVVIRNVSHQMEYLYADDNRNAFDNSRRNIFTWRKELISNLPLYFRWYIEPTDFGKYFKIRNAFYTKEYLYSEFPHDKDRRHVFLWRLEINQNNDDAFYWYFEPIGDNYFAIRNKLYSEYLYGKNSELDKRNVYSWRRKNCIKNGIWLIE